MPRWSNIGISGDLWVQMLFKGTVQSMVGIAFAIVITTSVCCLYHTHLKHCAHDFITRSAGKRQPDLWLMEQHAMEYVHYTSEILLFFWFSLFQTVGSRLNIPLPDISLLSLPSAMIMKRR